MPKRTPQAPPVTYMYLIPDTLYDGMVAGVKDGKGGVVHVARLFPHKPTAVPNDFVDRLLYEYPKSYGLWDDLPKQERERRLQLARALNAGIMIPRAQHSIASMPIVGPRRRDRGNDFGDDDQAIDPNDLDVMDTAPMDDVSQPIDWSHLPDADAEAEPSGDEVIGSNADILGGASHPPRLGQPADPENVTLAEPSTAAQNLIDKAQASAAKPAAKKPAAKKPAAKKPAAKKPAAKSSAPKDEAPPKAAANKE